MNDIDSQRLARRGFLASAGAAGLLIVNPQSVRGTQANSAVRIGVLGCGGRGTFVGTGFLRNTPSRVVALADLFQDQLDAAVERFANAGSKVDASQIFRGPKAHQEIASSKEVDMILITSPPYFHPEHLESAVAGGKHVYVEKPVAVDVPGCKRVIAAGEKADGKLSLDVGFQLRMAPPFIELVRRLHAGAIGEIAFAEAHYFCPFLPGRAIGLASPAERRLRHWLHDRLLSGDILVEQNIHVIDICNWALRDHPVKAVGGGGRKGRLDEGDAWSHFSLTFFYPNDVHVTFSSTQFGNKVSSDVCERFFGPRGKCQMPYTGPVNIEGEEPWTWRWPAPEPGQAASKPPGSNIATSDDEKQKAFIESIVGGKFHNQANQGVISALSCIMGRTAAYTGKPVTWEETYRSREIFDPRINLERL